jgi:hypothetical protein
MNTGVLAVRCSTAGPADPSGVTAQPTEHTRGLRLRGRADIRRRRTTANRTGRQDSQQDQSQNEIGGVCRINHAGGQKVVDKAVAATGAIPALAGAHRSSHVSGHTKSIDSIATPQITTGTYSQT